MARLSRFIDSNRAIPREENLERGRIWVYSTTTTQGTCLTPGNCFCWIAPAAGIATVEVWGPGGSGGRMCCCGFGLPGNPGAYAKKIVRVAAGCFIYGFPGLSCGNADAMNARGCSHPSYFCWFGNCGNNGFVCAQGGAGGYAYCISANSMLCCYQAGGFCATPLTGGSIGCGWVCNTGTGWNWIAQAFNGDVNCSGAISCVFFGHCNPCCICCHTYSVAMSPNIFSENTSRAIFTGDYNASGQGSSGSLSGNFWNALNALSRQPGRGMPMNNCWAAGGNFCNCYEYSGCFPYLSAGVPAPPTIPVTSVRDSGQRGGMGAVRIRFVQD